MSCDAATLVEKEVLLPDEVLPPPPSPKSSLVRTLSGDSKSSSKSGKIMRLLRRRSSAEREVQPVNDVPSHNNNLENKSKGKPSEVKLKEANSSENVDESAQFEKVLQLAIVSILVPILLVDYLYSGFTTGEPLFISDTWDMVVTVLYIRDSNQRAFGWDKASLSVFNGKRTKSDAFLILSYSFISGYFFYRVNGAVTKSILLLTPAPLLDIWFDSQTLLKFIVLGFLPAYFSPTDFVFRMHHDNRNQTVRVVGDFTWAVSKIDSLKRTLAKYYFMNQLPVVPRFIVGTSVAVLNCQVSSILKKTEINFFQNRSSLDTKRWQREMKAMLVSVSLKATIFCCLMLNLKFVLVESAKSSPAVFVVDVLALLGIFYRYSNDVFLTYTLSEAKELVNVKLSLVGAREKQKQL